MAPLSAYNLTTRWYFDYVTGDDAAKAKPHTILWRTAFDSATTEADIQNKFRGFLLALGESNLRQGWHVTGVRKSLAGTDFSVPVALGADLANIEGTGAYTDWKLSAEALEMRWLGRSPLTGVRARFSLYGFFANVLNDFRYTAAEAAWANNTVGYLNAPSTPLLVAGDNTVATWYPFVDANYNSYWEGELRN